MARAFVKELDGEEPDGAILERPQSGHPNYITLQGLERLKARTDEVRTRLIAVEGRKEDLSAQSELKSLQAELRYLEKRVQKAIPIDVGAQSGDAIRFGATVEMVDDQDRRYAFTIVGEDEADAEQGRISWVSPLGRELLDKRAGELVRWRRPAGDLELEVLAFDYGKSGSGQIKGTE